MENPEKFAAAWLEAWNTHDLDAIMLHYDEAIEFYSPVIQQLNNDPLGCLRGKENLRAYFSRGLQAYPELHFDLHKLLVGINSVVLYYKSINNKMSAELMVLNEQGLVTQVRAHYAEL
ncbi:nuclear transport factor 2 family protein [Chitinophaga silvatica]|uniref:Nuclear transport factor 2 family protein n=2 Tax=Chitinophaga silvatica TaxID=2282649 RepID=A0A3E1YAU8_9BACT|nr:nuclear transport factor 2 family protein [Chitinophaga silvatica]